MVAEKPSLAQSISKILSKGEYKRVTIKWDIYLTRKDSHGIKFRFEV